MFARVLVTLGGSLLCVACGSVSPRFTSQEEDKDVAYQSTGIASYYADEFHGRKTANGETYDMNALTAAHRTLPFNTTVRVRNLTNNRHVVVRINDRGPFKDDRIIDLSLEAARVIGLITSGTAPVELEILEAGNAGGTDE